MKVLITGANGMLGKDLVDVFFDAGHEIIITDRKDLDITDENAVHTFIGNNSPDVVINAAAYNLVDNIEDPKFYDLAYAINALGPKYLAEASHDNNAVFVHFSTDYVFSGEKPEGYNEDDERNPISKYGETKAAGEEFVENAGGNSYICRLSKIFGEPGKSEGSKESFVALMLRLAESKPELSIVDEEVGSPSYTKDIAERVYEMLESKLENGIYHIVNEGEGVTWYQFAEEFFGLKDIKTVRHPVSSSEFPKPAKRPKFAKLNNTKMSPLRKRIDALREFLKI